MSFNAALSDAAAAVGAQLDTVLADVPGDVGAAMRHACTGGKRLRAFLVLESARLYAVPQAQALWPAAGIEAMHAYSLIHDDLPAMDDDDLRRGQPTVHVKWDEATAILAGDALQSLAFECVTHPKAGPAKARAELALTLAQAAGARGMILGQAMDIAAETAPTPLSIDEITTLQAGKTGALFEWSAAAGPCMVGADPAPLRAYAQAFGLAFQIADDILDVEGNEVSAGKRVGKDGAAGKATFVSLLGLEPARTRAAELVDQACDALEPFGAAAQNLRDAARFAISRQS